MVMPPKNKWTATKLQAQGALQVVELVSGLTVERLVVSTGEVFQVVKELPENHYGRTCLACRCVDGRPSAALVCLKFTDVRKFRHKERRVAAERQRLQTTDPGAAVTFENPVTEVRCLAQMQRTEAPCPHIIGIHRLVSIADIRTEAEASRAPADKQPYFVEVLEAATGGELFDYVTSSALSLAEVQRIFTELMQAVAKLHANRIAHNDISAENVLLTSDLRVRLIDFGAASAFARLRSGSTVAARRPRGLPVKQGWASPEVYTSATYLPDKHDIWACGQILVFLLMAPRRILACPVAKRSNALFRYIVDWGAGRLVQSWKPELPPRVIQLVEAMLKVNEQERPSARQVLEFVTRHPFDPKATPPKAKAAGAAAAASHNGGTGAAAVGTHTGGAGAGAGAGTGAGAGAGDGAAAAGAGAVGVGAAGEGIAGTGAGARAAAARGVASMGTGVAAGGGNTPVVSPSARGTSPPDAGHALPGHNVVHIPSESTYASSGLDTEELLDDDSEGDSDDGDLQM